MAPHQTLRSDDIAALFAANDLPELIALANALGERATIWALLRPSEPKGQILVSAEGYESLDPLPASQIAGIPMPVGSQVAPASSPWAKTLLRLLAYQHDRVIEAVAVLPVWEAGTLIAVVGASRAARAPVGLLQGVGIAMRRLHQLTELRRDMDGAKYLLERSEKLVILATDTGKILLRTTGGLALMERLGNKERKDVLPLVLRKAVDEEIRQVVMGDIQANLSRLALVEPNTVSPLIAIRFSRQKQKQNGPFDMAAAMETLTPAETKVCLLLKTGLRDKEIADQLSISYHTAKHHVSHILRKLRCSDRLLLMARIGKPAEAPAPIVKNPIPPPLPQVTPLPPPKVRRVGSEPAWASGDGEKPPGFAE